MSERYGKCRLCTGTGSIKDYRLDRDSKEWVITEVTCPQCGGTGDSGDIQDYHD